MTLGRCVAEHLDRDHQGDQADLIDDRKCRLLPGCQHVGPCAQHGSAPTLPSVFSDERSLPSSALIQSNRSVLVSFSCALASAVSAAPSASCRLRQFSPSLRSWSRVLIAASAASLAGSTVASVARAMSQAFRLGRRRRRAWGSNEPLLNDPLAGKTAKQIFEDCVWLSDESTGVKLFLLCIHRFFDADCRSSSMSYKQTARDCDLT
jgi:hypothetical protein